ncbi:MULTISPECIES: bifunctional GNAT family N-acetyltransferase/nucleoside diphosphate kinase regulator [unclassified Devosia]|uniref:bifunctional GNAT family N-acetyltransferase/nucleoside diphosphate kinase regulator n=1 Tax=unclassified Devosia TaxID=196773 RepID=UPI0015560FB6|nr:MULTISPECIES: bifunctional GNAT family N-acetyltransferase/nucleoside diphosphate kinase regulator [unclassified Devosia]
MNKPFVALRPEITRTHAQILMRWLEDERVTRYLSDSSSVSRFIARALDRTQLPILTHLFNGGGRFFMAHDRTDRPVGFVRLVKTGPDCEIVLVIGDHDNWGRRLGASTIREGLKLAFLDMRARTVIAKIHPDNTRSLKAFERCGFLVDRETPGLTALSMTSARYLQRLRDGAMAEAAEIYITEMDKARLQDLMAYEQGPAIVDLEHEIERAIVVNPRRVAPDVVTMNSRLVLQLDDEQRHVTLVYPQDADKNSGKLSVLSDLGAAILGYGEGHAIDWLVSDRPQQIRIERVLYQPESAGHFHL